MPALTADGSEGPARRRLNLRARLTLLVAATLGPLAAFQVHELHQERERRIAAAIEHVQQSTRIGADRYRDAISDARSTLDLLSRVPDVVSETPAACQQFLAGIRQGRPWADAFFLVDVTGRIACSTVETAVGLDVARREWYLKTIAAGRFTVSDFYITLARKRPTVAAAFPMAPSTAGERSSVLMANLDLAWFGNLAETIGKSQEATVLLVDGAGRGLSHYPALTDLTGTDLSRNEAVKASLQGDEGIFQGKALDHKERIFGYRRLPGTDARLLVGLDRKAVLAPIDAAIMRAAMLMLALVALAGGVIWFAGRRIFVEPLVEASQALRKSEAFLRGIVDGSGDCIKVLDLSGNLEFISRNGQCLMEIDDPASVIGESFVGLFPADVQVEILTKLDDARAGATVRFDAAILTARGNPLHVDVMITPLTTADGRPERLVAIARDISDLKKAEHGAREAEILFRGLFDHSPNCLTVHQVLPDGSFRIETWNPESARIMGASSAAVRGRPVEEVLPPEPAAAIRADLEAVVRGGQIVRREGVQVLEDGSERIWDIVHVPLIDDTGSLTRILGAGNDVTHLRRIEQVVVESEARYRLLADNTTDMITHMDMAGQRLFVSPGSRDLLGYEPHELVGTSPQQMLHPDDAAGLATIFRDLGAGRIDSAVNVNRLRHRSGDWIWVEASLRLLRDGDGQPSGFVASIRSIMERRQVDEALRHSEARYRMLAETTSDVITRLDLSFRRDYISPSCRAMFGYDPDELVGADASQTMHPDDAPSVREQARRLFAGAIEGDRDTVTYRMRHKDGRWIWVENRVVLVRDEATGQPQGLVCSMRDVSDRQRQAEELRAAKEAAELARVQADAASRAKTDFLATMSHEIRTPLNAILGFTGLIMDRGADLPPDVYRQVELVQSSGAALLTVVNDILDFSKVEAGAIELEKRPFALGALIDNCLSIMRGTLRGTAVSVRANLGADLPRGVIGDEARLRQILLNLLNNAGKFTREGYVALTVRHEASSAKGERLRFSITDTGIGIPKEKQARLFERFSQADSSIKRDFGGTGLGLAICKRLVELMDGEIGVFSDEGQGATFWFTVTLPRGRLELAPVVAQQGEAIHKTGRLLLVEDLEINQMLARAVLEARGHTVDVVSDGAAAVLAVQDHAYDLVLMDVQMPGMDGMSATRIIRRTAKPGPRLPIIAMTANVLPEQIRSFREAGMDDHVGKPFQRAELYATIDQWLPDRDAAPRGGPSPDEEVVRATA